MPGAPTFIGDVARVCLQDVVVPIPNLIAGVACRALREFSLGLSDAASAVGRMPAISPHAAARREGRALIDADDHGVEVGLQLHVGSI
ncbi:hypothetical protein D3C78_1550630 [compost metagenome]